MGLARFLCQWKRVLFFCMFCYCHFLLSFCLCNVCHCAEEGGAKTPLLFQTFLCNCLPANKQYGGSSRYFYTCVPCGFANRHCSSSSPTRVGPVGNTRLRIILKLRSIIIRLLEEECGIFAAPREFTGVENVMFGQKWHWLPWTAGNEVLGLSNGSQDSKEIGNVCSNSRSFVRLVNIQ